LAKKYGEDKLLSISKGKSSWGMTNWCFKKIT
jgi:hypothetical protein